MNAHRSAWAMFGPRLWLVLAWMACIFLLSAQQGTESAGLSEAIARFLATCVSSIAQALGMDPAMFCVPVLTALFHPLVRKAAHATEYAVLAMLLVRWLAACLPGKRRVFMVAFGIACLYAVLDDIVLPIETAPPLRQNCLGGERWKMIKIRSVGRQNARER